ncbi:Transcription factor RAX2 [Hibiscus syriacus]|uniref:Transcription factor RAX2 n=1 Tax=Hibiscus syriacus TaxID=106335 RepID=A0A6A2YTV7_HIBSY|nr:Transcription factor RAX2 [Hibiscus syriacus]
MGKAPCCDKANVKRGSWSPDEDDTLRNYLQKHGTGGSWIALPRKAGLKRCGKSCRLRWLNYLRPDIKHGRFTDEEDNIICSLYNSIGSRQVNFNMNHWNSNLKKRLSSAKTNTSTSSVPVEAEALAHLNATGTTISSSPMADVEYQQNYDISGSVLDQIDQVPLPGLMDYSATTSTTASNNYSMSSSQDVSNLFSSSFFSLEDYSTAWSSNGSAEDQRIVLDHHDFEGPHYLFTAPDQM